MANCWMPLQVSGMSPTYVASFARPTPGSPTVSNEMFQVLLDNELEPVLEGVEVKVDPNTGIYQSVEGDLEIPVAMFVLTRDPELMFYVN